MPQNRTIKLSFITVSAIVLAAAYILFLNPHIDINQINAHDPGEYVSRAVSLLRGEGYGVKFAGEFLPVTIQTPAFSLVLMPVIALLGVNFAALKIYMVLWAFLLSASLFYFFCYFIGDRQKAALSTLLMMACPVLFMLSHMTMAEVPLFAVCFPALVMADRYMRQASSLNKWLFAAVISTVTAYYFKETALAIFAGAGLLILHPSFNKMDTFKKLVLFFGLSAALILPWVLWTKSVPDVWFWTHSHTMDYTLVNPLSGSDERLTLATFLVRIRHNIVWGMLGNMAVIFMAPFYYHSGSFGVFLMSLPIMIGIFWIGLYSMVKRPSVMEGFAILSLAVLVSKHQGPASRYLALIYPVTLVYFYRGIEKWSPKLQQGLVKALIVISIGTSISVGWQQYRDPYGTPVRSDYADAAAHARRMLPEDSTCYAPLTTNWQLLTGHACYRGEERLDTLPPGKAVPDYAVRLNNALQTDLNKAQTTDRYFLSNGLHIRQWITRSRFKTEVVYENPTYQIVRLLQT